MIYRYKVRSGDQRLYAVGDRQGAIQAARNTFLNHQMPIHKEKDQVIYHFPGGWFDRAKSAADTFYCVSGGPESDCFSIKYEATNNPHVTRLFVSLYHKTGWFRDKKVQERIKRFSEAIAHEFRLFKISLIDRDDWHHIVQRYPELQCSPTWSTSAEDHAYFAQLQKEVEQKRQ